MKYRNLNVKKCLMGIVITLCQISTGLCSNFSSYSTTFQLKSSTKNCSFARSLVPVAINLSVLQMAFDLRRASISREKKIYSKKNEINASSFLSSS